LPPRTRENATKSPAGRGRRLLKAFVDGLKAFVPAVRIFLQARGFDHAAAMSFYFILSLAPLTVLFFSAVGYIAASMGPDSAQVNQLLERITGAIRDYVPVEGETVRGIMEYLVSRRGSFSIVGTVVLIMGASAVFGALENATSDIFRNGKRRKYIISRLVFTVVIFAGGLLVFLFYNAATLIDTLVAARFDGAANLILSPSSPLKIAGDWLAVPLAFLVVLYLPAIARPPFRFALRGALLFFVLWTAARYLYSWYVGSVAEYSVLYGSLATPILLVLWLFYSALLVIFCLCYTAALSGIVPENR